MFDYPSSSGHRELVDHGINGGAALAGSPRPAPLAALTHWLTLSLDHVGRGMLLVGPGGQVLHANRLARSALASGELPLRVQDGRLATRNTREDRLLADAIDAALHKGLQHMLTLGRGADDAAALLTVAVLPIMDSSRAERGGAPAGLGTGNAVLISLPQSSRTKDLAVQIWARQHGLTDAETAVLEALLQGMAPPAIARAKGVALCTVRTHIGKLRAKTNSHTIRELLDRVSALPPMMVVVQ
jgi:DNA-binding CsgD family transcriptional regulator